MRGGRQREWALFEEEKKRGGSSVQMGEKIEMLRTNAFGFSTRESTEHIIRCWCENSDKGKPIRALFGAISNGGKRHWYRPCQKKGRAEWYNGGDIDI